VRAGTMWVIWLLAGLIIVSLAIMIDRARALWSKREDITTLVLDLRRRLSLGEFERARTRLSMSPSVAAVVVVAGLEERATGETLSRRPWP